MANAKVAVENGYSSSKMSMDSESEDLKNGNTNAVKKNTNYIKSTDAQIKIKNNQGKTYVDIENAKNKEINKPGGMKSKRRDEKRDQGKVDEAASSEEDSEGCCSCCCEEDEVC